MASGHNDTTKTALQNLINSRKPSNVMQTVQQQQINLQQQPQNNEMFNQQRAFSQVAPNVRIIMLIL